MLQNTIMQKLHCYVDETGQDTVRTFYLVSVVVIEQERDALHSILETIEKETAKNKPKWNKSSTQSRAAYIRRGVRARSLPGCQQFGISDATPVYVEASIHTAPHA